MRIGLISREYPPFFGGGVGTYVFQMSRALAEAGHDVHVFTVRTGESDDIADPPGVEVHREFFSPPDSSKNGLGGEWTAANEWFHAATLFYRSVMNQQRIAPFEVVEVPEWEASAWMLLADPEWTTPTVIKCHTPTWLLQDLNSKTPLPGQNIELLHLAMAEGVCAPCTPMAQRIAEKVKTEHPIEVIPYPYYADDVVSDYTPPRSKTIVYVGRFENRKGVIQLAKALNIVFARHPDAQCMMIGGDTPTAPGGGSMREKVRSLIESRFLDQNAVFVENVPAHELFEIHRTAQFFVFPSLFENFPNVCLEAMASGRTAVVGSDSGMVEMLEGCGVPVKPGDHLELADAMIRLLENPDQCESLGKAAYRRVRERFLPSRIAREKVAYYEKVIARAGKSVKPAARFERVDAQVWQKAIPELARAIALLHSGESERCEKGNPIVEKILDAIKPSAKSGTYALYGAGRHTKKLMPYLDDLERSGVSIQFVIDDDPKLRGTSIAGIPVITPSDVRGEAIGGVILSSDAMEPLLWEKSAALREEGIPVYRLYDPAAEGKC